MLLKTRSFRQHRRIASIAEPLTSGKSRDAYRGVLEFFCGSRHVYRAIGRYRWGTAQLIGVIVSTRVVRTVESSDRRTCGCAALRCVNDASLMSY